jgi:hypothetical protein
MAEKRFQRAVVGRNAPGNIPPTLGPGVHGGDRRHVGVVTQILDRLEWPFDNGIELPGSL